MRARRPVRPSRSAARPAPTARHLWLAALGLLVAGPRQARRLLRAAPELAQALWPRVRPARRRTRAAAKRRTPRR